MAGKVFFKITPNIYNKEKGSSLWNLGDRKRQSEEGRKGREEGRHRKEETVKRQQAF